MCKINLCEVSINHSQEFNPATDGCTPRTKLEGIDFCQEITETIAEWLAINGVNGVINP